MLTAFSDAHGLLPGPSPAPPTTRQRLRPAESWRAAPDRRMAPAPELSSAIQERRLPTLSAGPRPALAAQANSSPGRLLTEVNAYLTVGNRRAHANDRSGAGAAENRRAWFCPRHHCF